MSVFVNLSAYSLCLPACLHACTYLYQSFYYSLSVCPSVPVCLSVCWSVCPCFSVCVIKGKMLLHHGIAGGGSAYVWIPIQRVMSCPAALLPYHTPLQARQRAMPTVSTYTSMMSYGCAATRPRMHMYNKYGTDDMHASQLDAAGICRTKEVALSQPCLSILTVCILVHLATVQTQPCTAETILSSPA